MENKDFYETASVGLLTVRYQNPREQGKFKASNGTGTLYTKLTNEYYVVVTAAHNFQICDTDEKGITTKRHPDKAFFFLQRNGGQWKAKFKIIQFDIYSEYQNNESKQNCYEGCDIALCLVQLEESDLKKNPELPNQL